MKWNKTNQKTLYDTQWFKLHASNYEMPNRNLIRDFHTIEYKEWVHIIPLTKNNQVVMIEQYRPGVDKVCYEFPGGIVEDNEDIKKSAKRELIEETGYDSNSNLELIYSGTGNPAMNTNMNHGFLIKNCIKSHKQDLDRSEDIKVHEFSIYEIHEMIKKNELIYSTQVATFLIAFGNQR